MKVSEILVGRRYRNVRGSVREVVFEGGGYRLYPGVEDTDCIRYRVVMRQWGGLPVGAEGNMTRRAFASWAYREVTGDGGE